MRSRLNYSLRRLILFEGGAIDFCERAAEVKKDPLDCLKVGCLLSVLKITFKQGKMMLITVREICHLREFFGCSLSSIAIKSSVTCFYFLTFFAPIAYLPP